MERVSEKFDYQTCADLLWYYSTNKHDLDRILENIRENQDEYGNKSRILISTCNDDYVCEECKKLAKKKYPKSGHIPELPYPECTSVNGCRCGYSLLYD